MNQNVTMTIEHPIDVSIVIVSWNAKAFLKQCLESVYSTIREATFEVWVIDNDSSDGSPEMVKNEFPQVKLICSGHNLGFAKANNIAIKRSRGQYLCLINPDIEVQQDCISRMILYMDEHPDIGMLGPKVLNPDQTLQHNCRHFPTLWNCFCRALALDRIFPQSEQFGGAGMSFFQGDRIRDVNVLTGVFWCVRRKALVEVGLLDERFFMYSEDFDWCKRFHMAGWKVVFYPDAKVVHYGGGSSSNAPVRFYIEMQRSYLQYWQKHHSRFSQICFVSLIFLHQVLRVIGHIILYMIGPSRKNDSGHKVQRSVKCLYWLFRLGVQNGGNEYRLTG